MCRALKYCTLDDTWSYNSIERSGSRRKKKNRSNILVNRKRIHEIGIEDEDRKRKRAKDKGRGQERREGMIRRGKGRREGMIRRGKGRREGKMG
tara:strand:- start:183 stop:464 length:282 start_codon:yes stop_codon:yes gene_type:complete